MVRLGIARTCWPGRIDVAGNRPLRVQSYRRIPKPVFKSQTKEATMIARTKYVLFFSLISLWGSRDGALAAEIYAIDPAHTSVVFSVGHTGLSYTYGVFRQAGGSYISGRRRIRPIAGSSLRFKLRASIRTMPNATNISATPIFSIRSSFPRSRSSRPPALAPTRRPAASFTT